MRAVDRRNWQAGLRWLWTAVPFALLVNSARVQMTLQIERDGSARRVLSVETAPYFRGEVARWANDVQAGHLWDGLWHGDTGTMYTYMRDYRVSAARNETAGGELTIEDVWQNPLSLFTTYTWEEELQFQYLYKHDQKAAASTEAHLTYEIVMPGPIIEATVREAPPKTEAAAGRASAPRSRLSQRQAPTASFLMSVAEAQEATTPSPATPGRLPASGASEPAEVGTAGRLPVAPAPAGEMHAASGQMAPPASSPGVLSSSPEASPASSASPAAQPAPAPPEGPAAAQPPSPSSVGPNWPSQQGASSAGSPGAGAGGQEIGAPPGSASSGAATPATSGEEPRGGPKSRVEIQGRRAVFTLMASQPTLAIHVVARRLRWDYLLLIVYVLAFIAYQIVLGVKAAASRRPRKI